MRIQEIRNSIGMTQKELALEMGVDCSTVAKWETEVALPKARDLPRLAYVLKRTISDLFLPLTEEAC